jgi:threonyl-tRNA synthetase
MKRKFQCGTIQLDFNAPIRFNLQYKSESAEEGEAKPEAEMEFKGAEERNDKGEVIWKEGKLKTGFERPVVVHRAILGSIERMSAILIEHYAGKWPFWLSPRQIMVIPVAGAFTDYAEWLVKQFMLYGFHAEVDTSSKTMPKKIRDAQLAQWNYIAVVGEKEESEFSVNIRQRDEAQPLGTFSLQDFIARLQSEAMPTSQPLNTLESYKGKSASEQIRGVGSTGVTGSKSKSKQVSGDSSQEALFRDQPYVKGFHPTSADLQLFTTMRESEFPSTPNLQRWFDHIESFTPTERSSWPDA